MASYSSLLLCASLLIVAALACRTTQGGWVPTEEEDAELEAQLKQLNKPAVKTIQSVITGELFDCVDFYKQPAFDNPLLKDHMLQLRASGGFAKKLLKSSSSSSRGKLGAAHWGYNDSCPIGTVLIRRATKEDLIASKRMPSRLPRIYGTKENGKSSRVHNALLYARNSSFAGFKADLTTWEIPDVKGDQYSGSIAWIEGPPSSGNAIAAGWHVYPLVYNDSKPRFYTYWERDDTTGCFNMLCSGFAQTSRIFGPGSPLPEVSHSSSAEKHITITLYKNTPDRYWWVEVDDIFVGYWPMILFNNLEFGKEIDFGGQVYSPSNQPSPRMGNGKFPGIGSAYFRNVQFADEQSAVNYEYYTPNNKDLNFYIDLPDQYKIWKDSAADANFNVAYGGPGGYKSI